MLGKIISASRDGDLERVMELLLAGFDAAAEHAGSGITPLHNACWGLSGKGLSGDL